MKKFLKFIYANGENTDPYKNHNYVSFKELETEGGYSKEEIFNYIEKGIEQGLIYTENNAEKLYSQRMVALNSKGEFYIETLK